MEDCNSTSVENSAGASSVEKGATSTYIGTESNSFAQKYSFPSHDWISPNRAKVGPENSTSISWSLNGGLEQPGKSGAAGQHDHKFLQQ